MLRYLIDAFSGPAAGFMYALLAVMAFALAVMVERAAMLLRFRADGASVVKRVEDGLRSGTLPALGTTPLEEVVAAGLAQPTAELGWDAMSAAAVEAEDRIRHRIPYLSAVASIATMLGLFGTVYGLIVAFGALGDVAAAQRAAALSEGSSTAMATTAFGLFVAIPALAAHSFLDGQARRLLAAIEAVAGRVHVARKAAERA
ncbi:MAG: MotA/TolQ/ExbB proton channel family protein [Deltaproteobacteria bacterium]|nr:MotA/TolQ/ExbB proton channel family protein [Deltaproteobacteria bacterium]MBM4391196.1 MotA/TolQ/ExbB proton channel family protein [Deltaproteobacteria bacterium]